MPVGIIGIGCRLPGGIDGPATFWDKLICGQDLVSDDPAGRFDLASAYHPTPGLPDKVCTRAGSYIDGIELFDAAFFGISPREASAMDPQQRLLLQAAWNALEDGGIPANALRGTNTGVFLATQSDEYLWLNRGSGGGDLLTETGGGRGTAAARISHTLGLEGPSLTIDADRSSSLVAVHMACQSLRLGECDVVLCGASNLILTLAPAMALSGAGLLAPGGRCRFGDAAADGIVRGEAVIVVCLKLLEKALRDGDPVYATIEGSAVLHCGGSAGDLMTPSVASQATVLRRAWGNAGIGPADLQYIEAHGTGNPKGDAVEIAALCEALAGQPRGEPCTVGSVKTNLGHTEAAGGLAGLVKTALALHHGQLPPTLHFRQPHPEVPWDDALLRVHTEPLPWPGVEARRAGVSSFGLTGMLAHVVLGAAPHSVGEEGARDTETPVLVPLSARSPGALQDVAAQHVRLHAGGTGLTLAGLSYTAAHRRPHHFHRAAIVARSADEYCAGLEGLLSDGGPVQSRCAEGGTVLLYSGHGSQWPAMGQALLRSAPAFRTAVEEFDGHIREQAGWSVLELLETGSAGASAFAAGQPLLVATMLGLTAMLRSWGIRFDAVAGASIGEVAAACASGAIGMHDAAKIVIRRSTLLEEVKGQGSMAIVRMPRQLVGAMVARQGGRLSIACCNGPRSTAVVGPPQDVGEFITRLQNDGVWCAYADVATAAHSSLVDPLKGVLQNDLASVAPGPAATPFWSSVKGRPVRGEDLTAAYWAANLREPVMITDAVAGLLACGHTRFIEVSPHPLLCDSVLDAAAEAGVDAAAIPCLRREAGGLDVLMRTVAAYYTSGGEVDWAALTPPSRGAFVRLPPYPWEGKPYWTAGPAAGAGSPSAPGAALSDTPAPQPTGTRGIRERLTHAKPRDREAMLCAYVTQVVAEATGLAPGDVGLRIPFRDLRVTSLMATEIHRRLDAALGTRHAASLLFNYPDVERLTQHLLVSFAPEHTGRHREPAAPGTTTEPIAIVGIGCRFPGGGNGPDAFWKRLLEGVNAVAEVPPDRWDVDSYFDADPAAPGKMYSRWGAFLDSAYSFDAGFFGVTPRQAQAMDPQQRLLLETAWEAMEDAGTAPGRLAGTSTGVFIGMVAANDYATLKAASQDTYQIDAHDSTGSAAASAAGRLSYTFGFHGPSICVDTACSSSLVAVHLACQSLRQGECTTALAGGVNLMLAPDATIAYCKTRMLSPTGLCRTFDALADGYVRGEGCGLVVLKTLSQAEADQDRILAVIRGTAVNQDGRTSGLTAPNGLAQRALLRLALSAAGASPEEVSLIEAHGTGTALGDPIEVEAIGDVVGRGRAAAKPCLIGSVKTNIGHLEGAAGIAGLIKTVLSLRHRTIPPHLHLHSLNRHIDALAWGVSIPTAAVKWEEPAGGRLRVAGVSSFGFTGTNAHAVLSEARGTVPAAPARPAYLITCSARGERSLRELAGRYGEFLRSHREVALADFAFTANCGRDRFAERLALVASSSEEAAQILQEYSRGALAGAVVRRSVAAGAKPAVAFLFSRSGAAYSGLGRALFDTEPVFRSAIQECSSRLGPRHGRSLLEAMYGEKADGADDARWSVVAHFCLQYSLAEVWKSWGLAPEYVLGHGHGEYAAACTAGLLSLDDALRLVATASGLDETSLEQVAATMRTGELAVPYISSTEGRAMEAGELASGYWSHGLHRAARFAEAMETLQDTGCAFVLEIGAEPGSSRIGREFAPEWECRWLASLSPDKAAWRQMLEALGELYAGGDLVDLRRFHQHHEGRKITLPTYPFERKEFRIGRPDGGNAGEVDGSSAAEEPAGAIRQSGALALARSLDPAERESFLLDRIGSVVARMVGVPLDRLSPGQRLDELGLDSLLSIDLVFALEEEFGTRLPATLIVDRPTVAALSAYFLAGMGESTAA